MSENGRDEVREKDGIKGSRSVREERKICFK